MTCRKRIRRCQNRGVAIPPGSAWGEVLKLPKRHPAWRRREAQSGSKKKLTCSGHATNSRRTAHRKSNIVSFAAGRQCRWSTCTERENLAGDAKGKGTSGSICEAESTDAPEWGGLLRISDEAG